jgi:hypothetical protein
MVVFIMTFLPPQLLQLFFARRREHSLAFWMIYGGGAASLKQTVL